MAQSLANVLLHVIWSTKNREPWINDEVRPRFHGYIGGVFEKLGMSVVCAALSGLGGVCEITQACGLG
jgi:Transposase IS200 like